MRLPTDDVNLIPGGGITNHSGIPEPIASAIAAMSPGRPQLGKISVPDLLTPVRIRTLLMRHWDDEKLTWDVSDRVAEYIGTAAIQQKNDEVTPLSVSSFGWLVSGRANIFRTMKWNELDEAEREIVADTIPEVTSDPSLSYSTLSVGVLDNWKVQMHGSGLNGREEWKDELDLVAHLIRDRLQVDVHLGRNPYLVGHPEGGGKVLHRLRKPEEAREFFDERVSLHRRTMLETETKDDKILLCTDNERWKKSDAWAVVLSQPGQPRKDGSHPAARAKKVFRADEGLEERDARKSAGEHTRATKKKHTVKFWPGESVRCHPKRCPAFAFCGYGQRRRKEADEAQEKQDRQGGVER